MQNPEIKSVLITGANAGIGKEIARQLAVKTSVEKIYLGCRNKEKALAAQRELETVTGRKIFRINPLDVSSISSVRRAMTSLVEPIDALIMNAGGAGGKTPMTITEDGVTYLFAQNVLGHAVLLEGLLHENLLTRTAIYLGSEGARGVANHPDTTSTCSNCGSPAPASHSMRGDVQQRSLRFHLVALCLFPRLLPCKRPSVAWCGKIHGVSREWARRLRQDFAQQFDGKMRFPRRTARHKEEQDEEAKLTCKSNGLPLLLLHGNAHGYRGKSNRAKPDYRSSGCPESSSSPRRNESR
jgi:NADP-dependent 3-hydroxy acid dehydrogenase YdfG